MNHIVVRLPRTAVKLFLAEGSSLESVVAKRVGQTNGKKISVPAPVTPSKWGSAKLPRPELIWAGLISITSDARHGWRARNEERMPIRHERRGGRRGRGEVA